MTQDNHDERLNVLITGAGVAGLTLAALLRQQGVTPTIVERANDLQHTGYMLGMYPLGGRILHGLGLHDLYLEKSGPARVYTAHDGTGRLTQRYDLEQFISHFGAYRALSRGALIDVLRQGVGDTPIHFGTTVECIVQRDSTVEVTFSDGTKDHFDLVVGADGLHSRMREMLLRPNERAYWKTGWGGWVCWADASLHPADTYSEAWGAGRFLGLYPTPEHLGVFVGGNRHQIDALGPVGLADDFRLRMSHFDGPLDAILDAVRATDDPFFWDFHDCHTKRWHEGRVVLLGDAAVGILPTAGVGASVAMDAAAALADELARTDAAHIPYTLDLFVRRQRPRAEAAQKNSRQLARWMMVDGPPTAWLRDSLAPLLLRRPRAERHRLGDDRPSLSREPVWTTSCAAESSHERVLPAANIPRRVGVTGRASAAKGREEARGPLEHAIRAAPCAERDRSRRGLLARRAL